MALELKVFQVVGFQNSGKTTLVASLVRKLTDEGYKVGTIKHHGHGGAPAENDQTKDTGKHRDAGAVVTAVEGEGVLQVTAQQEKWNIEEIINMYRFLKVDMIIVEGYKKESYPKVVLLRNESDEILLEQVDNINAAISWYRPKGSNLSAIPFFHIKEQEAYVSQLTAIIKGEMT